MSGPPCIVMPTVHIPQDLVELGVTADSMYRTYFNIDFFMTKIMEAYERSGNDIKSFITLLHSYFQRVQSTLSSVENPVSEHRGSRLKVKDVYMNDNLYDITTMKVGEVYHNIYPFQINPERKEFFTYLFDESGLHIGRFKNSFEIGTGHEKLSVEEDAQRGVKILIAGEMVVHERRVIFNFQSGTYSKNLNLDYNPEYKAFLIYLVSKEFASGDMKVEYTDAELFPEVFPSITDSITDCKEPTTSIGVKYKDSIERRDFCKDVRIRDVDTAIEYFRYNPYQYIIVSDNKVKYHNPDPQNPTSFVPYISSQQRHSGMRKSSGHKRHSGARKSSGQKRHSGMRKSSGQKRHSGMRKSSGQKRHSGARKSSGQKKHSGARKSSGQKKHSGMRKSSGQKKHSGMRKSSGQKKHSGIRK